MKNSLWLVLILLLVCVFTFSACDNKDTLQKPNDTPSDTTGSETDTHVHAFGDWRTVKDATCTNTGKQERSCACGKKETQTINALGHVEVIDAAVSPTNTTTGLTEGKHCSVCNTIIVAQQIVAKIGHTYTSTVTTPTCTTQGYTTYTCKCGDKYVDNYINATGHNYKNNICATCGDDPKNGGILQYTDAGSIGAWQDGAIWDGKLFALGSWGSGAVYDINTMTKLGSFSFDKVDILKPHANSVCFGSDYYAKGDKYPLLYVNIYNNYSSETDRLEGTCCVYRITEKNNVFTTKLVQVIRIGFVEDLTLWKSKENNGDKRPYGNFVVDTDNNKLYAYVMRDADNKTRFFRFDLPAVTDGKYNQTYGCNVVTLGKNEIEQYFDTGYFKFMQGGTYCNNMIISVEGFGSGGSAEPAIRIVDLTSGRIVAMYYLANSGLTSEPEIVCVDPETGLLYYASTDGILRILEIPNIIFS